MGAGGLSGVGRRFWRRRSSCGSVGGEVVPLGGVAGAVAEDGGAHLAVAAGEAFGLLAAVLAPRRDDERLEQHVLVLAAAVEAPPGRTGAPPRASTRRMAERNGASEAVSTAYVTWTSTGPSSGSGSKTRFGVAQVVVMLRSTVPVPWSSGSTRTLAATSASSTAGGEERDRCAERLRREAPAERPDRHGAHEDEDVDRRTAGPHPLRERELQGRVQHREGADPREAGEHEEHQRRRQRQHGRSEHPDGEQQRAGRDHGVVGEPSPRDGEHEDAEHRAQTERPEQQPVPARAEAEPRRGHRQQRPQGARREREQRGAEQDPAHQPGRRDVPHAGPQRRGEELAVVEPRLRRPAPPPQGDDRADEAQRVEAEDHRHPGHGAG